MTTKHSTEEVNYDSIAVAQMCEIAVLLSKVETDHDDLHDLFSNYVEPIFTQWKNGLDKGIFKNEEEEGYVSAYAERVIHERYSLKAK